MRFDFKHIRLAVAVALAVLSGAVAVVASDAGECAYGVSSCEERPDGDGTLGSTADSTVGQAFILSGQTAETTTLTNQSITTTPAQVVAQRRIAGFERTSLARTLAEHFDSTVTVCRFGLLDFKHIIHSNHSFLLLIDVLII